jgi:predicted HNH restriction endonuclease
VYHIDGDISNCKYSNLKTVCANCQRILHKLKQPWRRGDLTPDF